jgi:hypothetical protein
MSSSVAIYAPDGTLGSVPYENMHDALQAGGKIAVKMAAPDGTIGYVPGDRAKDAIAAGGKIQPISSPQTNVAENYGFTGSNMLSQAKEGLKQMGSGLYQMGKDVLMPPGNTEAERLEFLKNKYVINPAEREQYLATNSRSPIEAAGHTLASDIPLIGPWAAGLGEQAGTGDVGGALARGGTQIAAAELAKPVLSAARTGAGMARESIGGAIHTPEGELTPGAALTGKVAGGAAGAAAGAAIGHEYIGAMAGYKMGPSLMDRLFPEPADQVAARSTFQNTQQIAEAQEAAIKQDQQITNAKRVATARAASDEQASRDQLWQARDSMAQDLMTRQAVQDKLDASDVRAANAAARAKRDMQDDINNGYIQKGQDLMNRQKQQDALDQEAQRAAKEAQDNRDQHAQDLMNRQKQQDALDAQHMKALQTLQDARQQELGQWGQFRTQQDAQAAKTLSSVEGARQQQLSSTERLRNQQATALNSRGDIPQGNPTPFGPVAAPTSPMTSTPQDLISRTKKIITPGQSLSPEDLKRAGDFTQVPLARLKLLSSWGDSLAQNEITRRLRN